MTAREELRAWVTSRATTADDATVASKLIAAFVAEAVREDRKKRAQSADARIRDSIGKLNDIVARARA